VFPGLCNIAVAVAVQTYSIIKHVSLNKKFTTEGTKVKHTNVTTVYRVNCWCGSIYQ
jgi:hypothetical protein